MFLKKHGPNKHGLKKHGLKNSLKNMDLKKYGLKKAICEQFGIDFQSCLRKLFS